MEMAVRLIEMAETAMETDGDRWRWLRGHFPIPAGCWNRDFCPPKFVFDGGGAAELFWEKRRFL
jgi:hypothetical protein